MIVLNVGGGASPWLPKEYLGALHLTLDIDPETNPHLCMDARRLESLAPEQFDVIFCSHNLEHYSVSEVPQVLNGFKHILKPGGHVHIRVPSLLAAIEALTSSESDLDDPFYTSSIGVISFHDAFFGHGASILTGNSFQQHKCGFSAKRLLHVLEASGFSDISVMKNGLDLIGRGYK
jgi:hypothetical protein